MIRTRAEGEIIRKMLEAAGEPRRFEMLRWLRGHRLTVQELVRCTGLAQPLVSHHLATLRASGLVGVEPDGRRRYHFLTTGNPLADKVLAVLDELEERPLPDTAPLRSPRVRRRSQADRAHPVRPAPRSVTAGFLIGDGTDAVARPAEMNLVVEPVEKVELFVSLEPAQPHDFPDSASRDEGGGADDPTPAESKSEPETGPGPESESEPGPEPEPEPESEPESEPTTGNDIEDFLL